MVIENKGKKSIRRPVFKTTCLLWNCKKSGSRCRPRTWTVQCKQKGEGKKMKLAALHFSESLYVTHWWKVLPSELSWMSSVISLLEFLLSPWGKRVTDWCKFLPEPPHVPSICILQWTDTVSAPGYFILRPLKSCWETRVREMVPGIRVLGWEGDLVSRDVGLCQQTIILLHNIQLY